MEHICTESCQHDNRPFLQLHTHTNIGSVRDCTASVEEMFKVCSKNNMSWAVTDHGWSAAWAEVHKQSKKWGVKPVYGVEFYLSKQRDRLFYLKDKISELKDIISRSTKEEKKNIEDELRILNFEFEEIKKYNHICIIAKNELGFRNLISLHNEASLYGFYGKPLVSINTILNMEKDRNGDRGVVVTSACLSGVIPRDFLNGKDSSAESHCEMMKEEFPNDWYLEIQPHELQEQRFVNEKIVGLSKKYKVPVVVGTDSHYLSKDYSRSHEIFLLLQGEQKVSDIGKKVTRITYSTPRGETRRKKLEKEPVFMDLPISELKEGMFVSKKKGIVSSTDKYDAEIKKIEEVNKVWMIEAADLSFKTEKELRSHMEKFPEISSVLEESIKNNKDILEKIKWIEWDNDLKLPIEEGAEEKLFETCISSLKEKGLYSKKEYIERFKTEFTVIKKGGLASYFTILMGMIDYAKERGLPVGPGRGCFLPKNKIKTVNRGNISIEDIRIGDKVITQDLSINSVLNVFDYNVEENVISIKTKTGKTINGGTKDHRVYAIKRKDYESGILDPSWISLENLKEGDYVVEYEENVSNFMEK